MAGKDGLRQMVCRYLVDHNTKTTSWAESAKGLPDHVEKRYTPEGRPYFVDHKTKTTSWVLVDPTEEPLPRHWEKRFTPQGRPYYVDHNAKITSWADPRLQKTTGGDSAPTSVCLCTFGRLILSLKIWSCRCNQHLRARRLKEYQPYSNALIRYSSAGKIDGRSSTLSNVRTVFYET
jgi:hypothetical protein